MPGQLESLPLKEPIGRVGPNGLVMLTPQWHAALGRVTQLLQAETESGTTANRPTKGLYNGRKFYDTTLGAVLHWDSASATWKQVIDTDTIQDATAVAKGWVMFTTAGGVAIADSYNVTSVDDNGSANYDVNWDTDFASGNYSTGHSVTKSTAAAALVIRSKTAGAVSFQVFNTASGAALTPDAVDIQAYGDQ